MPAWTKGSSPGPSTRGTACSVPVRSSCPSGSVWIALSNRSTTRAGVGLAGPGPSLRLLRSPPRAHGPSGSPSRPAPARQPNSPPTSTWDRPRRDDHLGGPAPSGPRRHAARAGLLVRFTAVRCGHRRQHAAADRVEPVPRVPPSRRADCRRRRRPAELGTLGVGGRRGLELHVDRVEGSAALPRWCAAECFSTRAADVPNPLWCSHIDDVGPSDIWAPGGRAASRCSSWSPWSQCSACCRALSSSR